MGVLGLETGTPRGLCGQADSRDGRLAAVGHLENQRRPGCGWPGAHGALLQSPVCRQPWSGLLVFFCEMCLILALFSETPVSLSEIMLVKFRVKCLCGCSRQCRKGYSVFGSCKWKFEEAT